MAEERALRIFAQIVCVVQYLYSEGVMHRDIKPENILLDSKGDIKLCDFGWAQVFEADHLRKSLCGTYEYMAPELIFKKSHNEKIDVWCLGVLLYEMLHGRPPFKGNSIEGMQKQFQEKQICVKKSLQPEVKTLIKSMLQANWKKRASIDQIAHQFIIQRYLAVDENKSDRKAMQSER